MAQMRERNDTVLHEHHTELFALNQQLEVYCNRLETLLEIIILPELKCGENPSLSEESLLDLQAKLKSNLKISQSLLIKCTKMLKSISSLLGFSKLREHVSLSRNGAASVSQGLSSAESLHQISLQVNGLMSETDAFINGSIDNEISVDLEIQSLEKRNQELAQIVTSLRQTNDQLQEQRAKSKRLSLNFDKEKQELLEKFHKEQVSLKDQLQVYIQTIGILVAEKAELQCSLSLSQQTAKQKAGEVEELQRLLRASRQQASDLERELISLSNSNQQHEKLKIESSKEIQRLKLLNYKLRESSDRRECCSFLMKVARASFSIQAILLLLLGATILLSIEEDCHRLSNNFAFLLNPMLWYPDGPPPV